MEPAKTLLRTTVRTFFPHPKQILIVDALLLHSVLHIEDLAILLSSQPKDIRSLLNPLRSARLLSTQSRFEAKAGSLRGSPREYYYIPFHPAIDAIKFRIAKLRRKVESLYQQDETKRKDWRCPRCKAEYEELEILDKIGDEGFFCDKCGSTLVQNEAAAQDRGNHEKIRRLNTQLAKFDDMIARIDREEVPENDFPSAWERKLEVPREKGSGFGGKIEYYEVKRDDRTGASAVKRQELVDSKNLSISIQSGADREREMEEEKERKKQELAKQNLLPVWHTKSAIGNDNGTAIVKEESMAVFEPVKKEEDQDEKKINTDEANMQDEVAAYMAEMERERLERERQAQQDSDEEDDDEGDFEDVVGVNGSNIGTPMSSQDGAISNSIKQENGNASHQNNGRVNGLKREFNHDDDASSVPSSDANTPASMPDRDNKRVKFEDSATSVKREENGVDGVGAAIKTEDDDDSDEDEDFEDAM